MCTSTVVFFQFFFSELRCNTIQVMSALPIIVGISFVIIMVPFYKNILTTSAVSSTNLGSIVIFAKLREAPAAHF